MKGLYKKYIKPPRREQSFMVNNARGVKLEAGTGKYFKSLGEGRNDHIPTRGTA